MLTILLIIVILLLVCGWGGNRIHPVYAGGAPDLVWLVIAVLVIFLLLRLLGVL